MRTKILQTSSARVTVTVLSRADVHLLDSRVEVEF